MNDERVRLALIGLGLFALQLGFVPFISVFDFTPDLMLLWLVVAGIRRGQMEATVAGFVVGLLQDVVTTQLFGLAALTKTIAGFLAGYFFNKNMIEQTLGSYRLLVATIVVTLAHSLLYFAIFYQGIAQSVVVTTLRSSLGTTLYTSVLAILPMFAFSRSYHTQWTQ